MRLTHTLARIYRVLLLLYPTATRTRVAEDMEECFRDLCLAAQRERGAVGTMGVALRTFAELPLSAWRARRMARKETNRGRGAPMETLLQDIRYALRGLRTSPGFTVLAVFSLAVGVGANTSMFSLANGVLWQELPVPEAERLVRLYQVRDGTDNLSYPNVEDVREQADFFDGVFIHDLITFGISSDEISRIGYGEIVSGVYFEVLEVEPALGRFFDPATEGQPESPLVTVLSHHLWTESFGADPRVIGRVINLNGRSTAVIGVAPESFHGTKWGLGMDLWVPIRSWRAAEGWGVWEEQRGSKNLLAVARLAPGVEMAEANAGLAVIGNRLAERYPVSNSDVSFRAYPERSGSVSPNAIQLPNLIAFLAIAASGLVLLVACGNVASLLLGRAVARRREIGLRVALGAGRVRLLRQLLTESVILAGLGGAFGIVMAVWATGFFDRFYPALPYRFAIQTSPDTAAVLFAIAASLTATLVFGLAPALQASKPGVAGVLRGDERSAGGLRFGGTKLLNMVVVSMVSMAFVTLFLTGLFTSSLRNIRDMDIGFETEDRVMATLDLAVAGDSTLTAVAFFDRVVEEVAALPGVRGAAVSSGLPLADWSSSSRIFADGRDYAPNDPGLNAWRSSVSDEYFDVIGTRLVAGRAFATSDGNDAPSVVILNEAAAERLWPDEDAVGHRIRLQNVAGGNTYEVIGIAETGPYLQVSELSRPAFFRPLRQSSSSRNVLTVHAGVDPIGLVPQIRQAVKDVNPFVPLFNVKTAEMHVDGSLFLFRMGAEIATALGVVALILAAGGLYGVMTFRVRQRRREMGIRLALGARKRTVLGTVLGSSLRLTVVGMLIGSALALAVSGVLTTLVFGVAPGSPANLLTVAIGLALVALVATLMPALSASRADPVQSLRAE